jgi:hypothetical protein
MEKYPEKINWEYLFGNSTLFEEQTRTNIICACKFKTNNG